MTSTATAFRQSRIYAEGWNAARTMPVGAATAKPAASNPYPSEPERSRWQEGFAAASR